MQIDREGAYTSRFNRRHKLFGHLFSGRYNSLLMDGSGSGYLKSVCDYVHLNPARAKLVAANQPLTDFAWSPDSESGLAPSKRPAWLRVDSRFGIGTGRVGHPQGQSGGAATPGAGAGRTARRGGG